jgi:outer membrane protein assembly factor BamD
MFSRPLSIALGALLLVMACGQSFVQRIAPLQGAELFRAAMAEYEAERWDNAIAAFERLSRELAARDPLLPSVYYYLGLSHAGQDEHLLAAQSFQRIMEAFPNDTLADDGLLQAGRSYSEMWRKPALDEQYGETALSTFQTLLAVYPNSDVLDEARREMQAVMEKLARKDYEAGVYYIRINALESAIIFLEDVVERFPETDMARQARLRMLDVYKRREWAPEIREMCEVLRSTYPTDTEVRAACGAAADTSQVSNAGRPTI